MAIPGIASTVAQTNTRTKAVLMSGSIADSVDATGPLPLAAGVIVLQSTSGLLTQVVTTSATGLQRASFIYIPVTTGNIVGAAAPPFVQVGTPLIWNDASKVLAVWSSGSSSWLQMQSSAGGTAFTSS